jgi:hypothetical protein
MAVPREPDQVVRLFLDLMERRQLPEAQALLAPGFAMTFPGNVSPPSLEALVEWAKNRYRFVRKTYEHVEVCGSGGDHAVVYCSGTLSGEWLDQTTFEGIRFIDRFELRSGLIRRQSVWNDMALHTISQP